jgi:hypothetical protein
LRKTVIRATPVRITAAAPTMPPVSGSFANAQPRNTATTGLT